MPATTQEQEEEVMSVDRPEELVDEDARRGVRAVQAGTSRLEEEGDVAADYLEELLDIADIDGDIDIEVRNGRTYISIVSDEESSAPEVPGGSRRRSPRSAAGTDPPVRPVRHREPVPPGAGHLRLPAGAQHGDLAAYRRRRRRQVKETGEAGGTWSRWAPTNARSCTTPLLIWGLSASPKAKARTGTLWFLPQSRDFCRSYFVPACHWPGGKT